MTKKAFVIGHPIAHSRSPLIHGNWLADLGIDGSYDAIDVPPAELVSFFDRLRQGEFVGGNVTIPHKQAVFALCDSVDPLAKTIGAVNTLTVTAGKIHGTNTDYLGFLGNLDAAGSGWDDDLQHAIVLGAGGAARAIAVALQSRGVTNIHILNRTLGTAQTFVADLGDPLKAHPIGDFPILAAKTNLVINTTSIGMHGTRFDTIDLGLLPKTALVTDIVYVPLQTPLLLDAAACGLRIVDGLGMLLHQAVPGFEAWFGVRPVVTAGLRAAIIATLEP